MTKRPENMTASELIGLFAELSIAKGNAIMGDETTKANRLYLRIDAIESELRARAGDQRRLLVSLYQHHDPSVRLQAATSTLAVFPSESRQVLQLICDRKEFPFAGEAGMRLSALASGFFKPT